ncbi:hypothetical protein B566_EDAN002597 [Ephemera danica]|nr:hypothetical protein B566_EDAN002597 [Ephemera danica]
MHDLSVVTASLLHEDVTRVQSTRIPKVQTTTQSQRNPYAKRKFSWAELTADEIIDTKNCTPVNATLLVYNRVPKCGSSTLQSVLRGLASRNKFQHHSSKIYNQRMLTRHEEETLANDLRKRSEERRRNSTPHPEVSPEIRDALARNLTTDIELYSFAKQRLHQQLEFLGLPNFASEM